MRKTLTLFSFISFILLFDLISGKAVAQTYPAPFNLANGNFQFTSWDSLNAAGTYPDHMIFQYVPYNHIAPFYYDTAIDYSCPYNMTKRPRIIGYESKGIGFVTTSNSQYNDCVSGASDNRFVGTALLALNTEGRTNVRVQWKSETLIPGDGNGNPSTPRIWKIRLQYRSGNSGLFSDVPGPVEFTAGAGPGDSLTIGPTTLPADCFNKPLVQLRWIYFESSAGSLGTRPRLRLDDIKVLSDAAVGTNELSSLKIDIFPNPAHKIFYLDITTPIRGYIQLTDQLGNVLKEYPIEKGKTGYDCSDLTPGIYLVRIKSDNTPEWLTRKIVLY